MNRYLLIESCDPFESVDATRWCELAAELKRAGHEVTLFLVQNGVLAVRPHGRREGLERALKAGVEVCADDFSLRERGIESPARGVKAAPIDIVIDRMATGWSPIWH
jgi:predicted peroxiredoxin